MASNIDITKPVFGRNATSESVRDNFSAAKTEIEALQTLVPSAPLLASNNLSDVGNSGTAKTNLGLGTGDSPQFTALNIGHASDTTITRVSAGNLAVEGNALYRAGGTDVAVADGGTGASTAEDARINLGLDTLATQAANNVSITGGSITGITDLAIADGGTGASTAVGARTNLELGDLATLNTVGTSQIDNDAVTFAKIQNVTAARLLGRGSAAGNGDAQEITIGSGLALSGTTLATSGSADLPEAYIAGLTLSNNGTDANNDIDISAGRARDATNAEDLVLAAGLTKQLDAAWAVGTNQGGLDTGAKAADTMYAVWLIKRSDTGVVDVLLSASYTAPTMPTSYDYKRLIGSICTNASSNIRAFTQVGDVFFYTDSAGANLDVDDNTITSLTFETATLKAAPNSIADIAVKAQNETEQGGILVTVRPAGSSWTAATTFAKYVNVATVTNLTIAGGRTTVLVNASRQCNYAAIENSGTVSVQIATLGFRMLTRSHP
jgi:hypothetical protein